MKLFDDNFKYTIKGNELHNELSRLLQPFLQKELENGVSPRELSHLAHWVVNDIELDFIIVNDAKRHEADKNKHLIQSAATLLKAILKEKGFLFATVGIHAVKDKSEKIIIYSRKDKDLEKYIESCGNQFQTFKVEVKQIKEK